MWHELCNEEEINELLAIFEDFHDSCIKEVRYVTGMFVDDNSWMQTTPNSIEIAFESQSAKCKSIVLRFLDVLEFSINKRKNCIHEIFDISLFIKDGIVYWADSSDFCLEDKYHNESWLCGMKAMWKYSKNGM